MTRPAFPNGTSFDIWQTNWCDRCKVDAAWRKDESEPGCPLILTALCGEETPAEWFETEPGCVDAYRCVNFRSVDDPDTEPTPQPDPDGMDGLFPALERRVRMLHPVNEFLPCVRTVKVTGGVL
jgi:hypothetical protein